MRRLSDHARQQRLRLATDVFARGPLQEISEFRREADALMAAAHVGVALDLIKLCSELNESYRRSSRMSLSTADHARLEAAASGAVAGVLDD